MALSRFILPFADVGSGIKPSSGAQLFFYETGTTTLKNTYNCPDGTTANSNPVIADSTGLFPDIFISGTYKVVLQDKNNSQRWEADPVDEFAIIKNNAFTKSFSDLESAVSDTDLTEGDAANIKERTVGQGGGGVWDAVLSSSVTENTYEIVQCTGVPTLSLVLRMQEFVSMAQLGADTAAADNTAVWDRMLEIANSEGVVAICNKVYKFTQTAYIIGGSYTVDMTGGMILSDSAVVEGVVIGSTGDLYTGTGIRINVQKAAINTGLVDYGIVYVNCVENYFESPEQRNFYYGHACIPVDPNDKVAYMTTNNIRSFGSVFSFYTNPADGGAYVTENTYIGGRMHATVGSRLNSHVNLDDSSFASDKVEHIRFYGTSLEGWSGGGSSGVRAVWVQNAQSCVFHACRTEQYNDGWDVSGYHFENTSKWNYVFDTRFDATITDSTTGDGQTFETVQEGSRLIKRFASPESNVLALHRYAVPNGTTAALEVIDQASSGSVSLLKLQSLSNTFALRGEEVFTITTQTGQVFTVDDQGSLLPLSNDKGWLGDSTHKWKEQHTNLSTHADDTAAGVAGLTAGQHYQTATGELRVKL